MRRWFQVVLACTLVLTTLLSPVGASRTLSAAGPVEPKDVALRPSDLPPGFTVSKEETQPMASGSGIIYSVVMERPLTPEAIASGPIQVTQLIGRADQPVSYEGFLDELRRQAVSEEGYELVPGAPNDGGTASLQKLDGEAAFFLVGFIKREMVIFTGTVGRRGVVSLDGALTLAGVSSARYDSVLAEGAPASADATAPAAEPAASAPPPTPAPAAPAPTSGQGSLGERPAHVEATTATDGWATLVGPLGPDGILVEGRGGEMFSVWHLGIIGPRKDDAEWWEFGEREHRRALGTATRVWLEREPGVPDLAGGELRLRHVYVGDSKEPVAASLLRRGAVWVFPNGKHRHARLYAERQADAVTSQAGLWPQSASRTVFKPRGISTGGLPTVSAMLPALRKLDEDEIGHRLLVAVASYPVEVVFLPQRSTTSIGSFDWGAYSISLGPDTRGASPDAIAAVLIHELTHAYQLIDLGPEAARSRCYDAEIEAFEVSASYWRRLHGPRGKRPAHWLDQELNATADEYDAGLLDYRVVSTYGSQCRRRA